MTQGYGDELRIWRRTWTLRADSLTVVDHIELTASLPVTCTFVAPQAWEPGTDGREWKSGRLILKLPPGQALRAMKRTSAVLERAYPLEIALPAADIFELSWDFSWVQD